MPLKPKISSQNIYREKKMKIFLMIKNDSNYILFQIIKHIFFR